MSTNDQHSLIHPTYRHLERSIRLAGLSLAQWAQLVTAGAVAYALAQHLPFGGTYSVSVAVTVAGVPVAAAVAAGSGGVRPLALLVATVRWRGTAKLHLPGVAASAPPAGYRLDAPATVAQENS
jgi:hypothetical protein